MISLVFQRLGKLSFEAIFHQIKFTAYNRLLITGSWPLTLYLAASDTNLKTPNILPVVRDGDPGILSATAFLYNRLISDAPSSRKIEYDSEGVQMRP